MSTSTEQAQVEPSLPPVASGSVTGADPKQDVRCAECGYGAAVRGPLPACPMCGGERWDAAPWQPFTRRAFLRESAELDDLPSPLA